MLSNLYHALKAAMMVLAVALVSGGAWAEPEVLTIEGARIRGNQELPTVLYVVPWQPPVVESLEKPATSFALQRKLEPLERTEFQRLMQYHEEFKHKNLSRHSQPLASE
ncbi:MAG: hypothetical protein R3183_13545 [Oleiphilaceae bacterium]|nr:hypothetical protein [Oleiphilaceae bacterium]